MKDLKTRSVSLKTLMLQKQKSIAAMYLKDGVWNCAATEDAAKKQIEPF